MYVVYIIISGKFEWLASTHLLHKATGNNSLDNIHKLFLFLYICSSNSSSSNGNNLSTLIWFIQHMLSEKFD